MTVRGEAVLLCMKHWYLLCNPRLLLGMLGQAGGTWPEAAAEAEGGASLQTWSLRQVLPLLSLTQRLRVKAKDGGAQGTHGRGNI